VSELVRPAQGAPLHRRVAHGDLRRLAIEGRSRCTTKEIDELADSHGEYPLGRDLEPEVVEHQALRMKCEHFVPSVRTVRTPVSDGESGLRVVRVLDALQGSLDATRSRATSRR
jgi:hypothetical protein